MKGTPYLARTGGGMGCRSWVQIWPKFYHCNCCALNTIVSYIADILRSFCIWHLMPWFFALSGHQQPRYRLWDTQSLVFHEEWFQLPILCYGQELQKKKKTRQIWGIWKLRPAYSPETPNSGQKRWCFVPCDLEIWWMTLENNRAPLLCCFKLCATFHNHQWIQTGVAVQKRPISVKFDDF